jgi:hypothetical protein
MLKANTVTTVHQRLRDERGLGVRITTFRRYVWATMPDHQANRARVTVRRTTHRQARKPRSTTATLASGPDPASGKTRRVSISVRAS